MLATKQRTTAREKLLTAAQELMLERGYNATTVDDICTHAGVSKGSFYHFFDSKEGLGLATLEEYYNNGIARLMSGPFTREEDPIRRLEGFLVQTEEYSVELWGQGCLLSTFAVDLGGTHPLIRQRVAEQFDRLAMELSRLFEPLASRDGEGPTSKDLATSYLVALEGSIVLARAFNQPSRIRTGLETFRGHLNLAGK